MRYMLKVAVAAALVAMASPAWADDERVRILSILTSGQEVDNPASDPESNPGSTGLGRAVISFDDDDDDAGEDEELAEIKVRLLLFIRSGTDITRFHIHEGDFGQNGPIVVNFFDTVAVGDREPDPDTIPVRRRATRLSFQLEVDPDLADYITMFPERFYFNVHTEAFPAGEVRGQLSD